MELNSDCLGLASLLMTAARDHARSCENESYDNYALNPNSVLIGMGIGMGLILSLPNTIERQANAEPVQNRKEMIPSVEAPGEMKATMHRPRLAI